MKCSVYQNTFDRDSKVFISVETVLSWIKDGKFKSDIEKIRGTKNSTYRKQLKSNLVSVAFSGTFSRRRDDAIIDYNHLVTVDIDEKDESKLYTAVILFESHPSCYAYFRSPSGGLKALFLVDSESKYHSTFSFNQVKKMVEEESKCLVDPSGRNISRLCYVSYDPELFFNPYAEPMSIDTMREVNVRKNVNGVPSNDVRYIFNTARKWVNKNDRYYTGNRHNYLLKVSCIMNRAGVSTDKILNCILEHYTITQDMYPGLDKMMRAIERNYTSEFGSSPILVREKNQEGIF